MEMLDLKKNNDHNMINVINRILEIGKEKVKFIVLYGSAAKGELTSLSDVDLAVFYDGGKKERFDFRVKILGRVGDKFDIQTFQDLPLYIQKDILTTGKLIHFRDYGEVFEVFMKTIREFEDFKPRLELYYSSLGA